MKGITLGWLVMMLLLAGCDSSSRPESRTVRCGGIEWRVPEHWYSDVRLGAGGLFTLSVASFPLPHERDVVGEEASKRMGKNDIRMLLISYGAAGQAPTGARASMPLTIEQMMRYTQFEHMGPGHQLARKVFMTDGRSFDIQVEFGMPISSAGMKEADKVLRQLRIGPRTNVSVRTCRTSAAT